MTTYAWPTDSYAEPTAAELLVIDNLQRHTESPLSGYVQTMAMPGARWGWGLDFGAQTLEDRDRLEGFLVGLSGREHRVRVWDFKRPRPRGSINLTGVTSSGSTAQFATQMTLQGCGAGRTLLAGDWFATPVQLLRCVEDAAADGSGVMVVKFRQMLRAALAGGAAIALDKPTALYVRTEAGLSMPRVHGLAAPDMSIGLMEVFA